MKKAILHSAHFQLTHRCNLECVFCGQSKGLLASKELEMGVAEWIKIASQLKKEAEKNALTPRIMLWGGEPLLYEGFDFLANTLKNDGIRLSMVSNGTLLNEHIETVRNCIDTINISLDGDQVLHDSVRGAGVYAKVNENLKLLKNRQGRLVFLCTISDINVDVFPDLPYKLMELEPDEIILQPLMYLDSNEIAEYRKFSREYFNRDYPELLAWERNNGDVYQQKIQKGLEIFNNQNYPIPVRFTPHALDNYLNEKSCDAAWNRVHIRHDGEVGFCTDYFSFSAGNVKEKSLADIFYSVEADKFRQAVLSEKLPLCRHCPWRLQKF
ncbi:MAG: radical SAM protein [Lentisphaeria bacterium]|nr:radical SAM protein [Lentisphaeria bacterium]